MTYEPADKKFFLANAMNIAEKGHVGQKYGEHDYFTYHIQGVVNKTVAMIPKDIPWTGKDRTTEGLQTYYKYVTVAILHDWLEDCEYKDDHEAGIAYLLERGIPQDVIDAVVLLTKTKDTVIEKYLIAIRGNKMALAVKKADMTFNMTNNIIEGDPKRFSKYAEQMKILLGK